MSVIYFLIALGVLVLVHELGHFIVAKMSGIRVEKFSIGFGPKIIGFTKGETEYKIAPIPLGGYVKMTGEDPEEGKGDDPRSFANKSVWTRIKVVMAGPLMNIIFALVFMPIVFMIGRTEPVFWYEAPQVIGVVSDSPADEIGLQKGDLIKEIDGKKVDKWRDVLRDFSISSGSSLNIVYERDGEDLSSVLNVTNIPEVNGGYSGIEPMFFIGDEAKVDSVDADGPAGKAGMAPGDIIVAVNGKPIESWIEMSMMVGKTEGASMEVTIERNGKRQDLTITPSYNEEFNRWVIGVTKTLDESSGIEMVQKKYGFVDAVKNGWSEFVTLFGLTLDVLKKLFTLEMSYKTLGGPVKIAQFSMAAAKHGVGEFIFFMAFLSMQLGILNLLPIPILDGGHVLFCVIEGIIKRPLSDKVRGAAQYAGLAFILTMFFLITVNDVNSIWGIVDTIKGWFR